MTIADLTALGLSEDEARRAVALRIAASVLTVKAGRYADRPLDALDVKDLAEWLLDLDRYPDGDVPHFTAPTITRAGRVYRWSRERGEWVAVPEKQKGYTA